MVGPEVVDRLSLGNPNIKKYCEALDVISLDCRGVLPKFPIGIFGWMERIAYETHVLRAKGEEEVTFLVPRNGILSLRESGGWKEEIEILFKAKPCMRELDLPRDEFVIARGELAFPDSEDRYSINPDPKILIVSEVKSVGDDRIIFAY